MKEEKYLFDLSALVGNWESVNLHPTVIIYRNGDTYLLSIIHMNETSKQASPEKPYPAPEWRKIPDEQGCLPNATC